MALHLIRGRQLHGRIVHGVGDCQRHAISGMHVPPDDAVGAEQTAPVA